MSAPKEASGAGSTSRQRDYWSEVALLFAVFALLALANLAGRIWDEFLPSGELQPIYAHRPWVFWLPWVLAIPVVVGAARQWCDPGRARRRPPLGWKLGTPLLVVTAAFVARVSLCVVSEPWAAGAGVDWERTLRENVALIPLDLIALLGLSGTAIGLNLYRHSRLRAEQTSALSLRAARLESELARAQLAAYRGQLDPHFLFNSLNAVATLVRQQRNDVAVQTLAELSALLRLAAESVGQAEVPLRTELDFIRRYLAIESLRFGRKLHAHLHVPPEVLDLAVPNLLLQPLVENAIKHGISRRVEPGRLLISARIDGPRLIVRVENDPADSPVPPVQSSRTGLGLPNVRARLHYLYDSAADLQIRVAPPEPTVVEVGMPWRIAQVVAPAPQPAKVLPP